jgi:large subunit ribosomal protein L22
MGKPKAERRLADNEAMAKGVRIRTSWQKLNLVAQLIRGKKAEQAVHILTFSQKRMARDVKKVLQSAIANAENNHGLDVDKLFVKEAFVGPSMVMKRFKAKSKGRAGRIIKPFSNITVVVHEPPAKPAGSAEGEAKEAA